MRELAFSTCVEHRWVNFRLSIDPAWLEDKENKCPIARLYRETQDARFATRVLIWEEPLDSAELIA